ncbi:hypothetical protein [Streptomyces sp. NPDC015350]|uniref:hypothetical protein n=1 Tax=Streptomyces sp. NPDC015350 TaxID=3364955 RepID=UPI0037013D77
MKVTPSGYALQFEHVLDELRATAAQCKNPAHLAFVNTAIAAFEEDGPDAEPLLNGCPERIAQLIFDEVTEAYIIAGQAPHWLRSLPAAAFVYEFGRRLVRGRARNVQEN